MAALTLAARTEGIVLDPVCTGRAMAGLTAAVRDGGITGGQPTVFLHSGGLPGLSGHPTTLAKAAAGLALFDTPAGEPEGAGKVPPEVHLPLDEPRRSGRMRGWQDGHHEC